MLSINLLSINIQRIIHANSHFSSKPQIPSKSSDPSKSPGIKSKFLHERWQFYIPPRVC
nr:hypothetical protein HvNV057 [Heliothis virescens nudivirus]